MNTQPDATTSPERSLKVGLFLLATEGPPAVGWDELVTRALRAEQLGFDSIWIPDHLLVPIGNDTALGVWECWSLLAGLAAVTTRVELGPLVSSTALRKPAMLAKIADTVDEISSGRLVLGLGAGNVESESHAYGFPFGHRVSRFEEAIQIITGLLRDRRVDFEGSYYTARDCELRPLGPRPHGPPIMVGATGPRMLGLTARYAEAWNADLGSTPESIKTLNDAVDAACHELGRDPATLARSATLAVDVSGPSLPDDDWVTTVWNGFDHLIDTHFSGTAEELATTLRAYAAAGIGQVQVWLNPSTVAGIEAFAPVLDLLDDR